MTFRLNDLILELLENLPPLPPINYALIQGISILFFQNSLFSVNLFPLYVFVEELKTTAAHPVS